MTWVAQRVVGKKSGTIFNECLAVGYFEQGHMGVSLDKEFLQYVSHAWTDASSTTMMERTRSDPISQPGLLVLLQK